MTTTAPAVADLPAWLPDYALLYLRHVEQGIPIRELARSEGLYPSTVLRRVRRIESRRDDPLVDEALARLGLAVTSRALSTAARKEDQLMTAPIRTKALPVDEATLAREGRRILRRLTEAGALMIVAADMDKAVVLRGTVRIAVLERPVA